LGARISVKRKKGKERRESAGRREEQVKEREDEE
jgi:hypothetical protein